MLASTIGLDTFEAPFGATLATFLGALIVGALVDGFDAVLFFALDLHPNMETNPTTEIKVMVYFTGVENIKTSFKNMTPIVTDAMM